MSRPEVQRAQRAVHARMSLAFAAAVRAGLSGRFHATDTDGFLVVLTTAAGLGFLNTITVTDEAVPTGLPDVLDHFRDAGITDPVVVATDDHAVAELGRLGLEPVGTRPIAVVDQRRPVPDGDDPVRVTQVHTPDDRVRFLDVLAAGYAGTPEIDRFLRAEHSDEAVTGFLAWLDGVPVAVAALSVQADGVVLGGAATLPDHRGSGAQTALLRARRASLTMADPDSGTVVAATAAPGSPSLRNLERAGFAVHLRQGFRPGRR